MTSGPKNQQARRTVKYSKIKLVTFCQKFSLGNIKVEQKLHNKLQVSELILSQNAVLFS